MCSSIKVFDMSKFLFEKNYHNYIIERTTNDSDSDKSKQTEDVEDITQEHTQDIKKITSQIKSNLVPQIVSELEKQYLEKFKSIPNQVKDRFDTIAKQAKNIETRDEYIIAIESLKDAIVFCCDGCKNARREILKRILQSDKFKSAEER